MDNNEQRPNAALINREWFEAAKSALTADELAHLLVKSVEYVLYGFHPVRYDTMVETVFKMVKPALDSDIAKYRERCIRNAANAKSKRVAASGSEWERVGANTTTTTTTTTTSTPTTTTTPSLSPAEVEDREKWLIYGYFWSIGSNAINEECNAFWSYYEALGWKNNKGAAIVSKLAAARMWKRQFETKVAPNGADAWFKVMQDCDICDYSLWNSFLGAERKEDGAIIRLRAKSSWIEDFRAKCGNLLLTLQRLWRVQELTIEPTL